METADKMVYIYRFDTAMPDSIVINLNTAFVALNYYIANEIANIVKLDDIKKSLSRLQKLIEISTNKDVIIFHYEDDYNLAYYIMHGLNLKLEKELLYW